MGVAGPDHPVSDSRITQSAIPDSRQAAAAPAGAAATSASRDGLTEDGTTSGAAAAGGMTVYKDPVTGRLLPAPPAGLRRFISEELGRAVSTSHEDLVEIPAPGGGTMIDLQGRFRSLMHATVSAAGTVATNCDHGDAADLHSQSERRKE